MRIALPKEYFAEGVDAEVQAAVLKRLTIIVKWDDVEEVSLLLTLNTVFQRTISSLHLKHLRTLGNASMEPAFYRTVQTKLETLEDFIREEPF